MTSGRSLTRFLRLLIFAAWFSMGMPVSGEEVLPPGSVLEQPLDYLPWIKTFSGIAAADTVWSRFDEERWFPIRKEPVKLEGEMRFSHERGLSLAYEKPQVQMMILDDEGLLLRDGKGRERKAPAGSQDGGLSQALRAIATMDIESMADKFVIRGNRSGQRWRLDFEPIEAAAKKQLGILTVLGTQDRVERIVMARSAKQKVVVTIRATQFNRTFTPEELAKYFRRKH